MIRSSSSIFGFLLLNLLLPVASPAMAHEEGQVKDALVELGRSLFFDTAFSESRNLACATCHDPEQGFVDSRTVSTLAPVSLGSDGKSLGARNAPTISYLRLIPSFGLNDDNEYIGGFFHDGRAQTLALQASKPVLDPNEMALANEAVVMERLLENPQYVQSFRSLFGSMVFDSATSAVEGFGKAIAAFERTDLFAPFDSKYDRYLRGEYSATLKEEVGMGLFFTPGFTGCNQCHQLELPYAKGEGFTNNLYENIGVPVNPLLVANGLSSGPDEGLANNPLIASLSDAERQVQKGRFKVPTLRNVAVTAPYMHNGVFKNLRTVIKFYNKFNGVTNEAQTNPETRQDWGAAEVEINVAEDKLKSLFLTERQIDALMAFLLMLTDQRYEPLLEE